MVGKKQKHLVFLLSYASIFHMGPWRNSIQLFLDKGYKVTLIQFDDHHLTKTPMALEEKYSLIQIPYPFPVKVLMYMIKAFFRFFSKLGFVKFSKTGDALDYLFKGYYYANRVFHKMKKSQVDVFIPGDPPSMLASHWLARRSNVKIFFWELELLIEKELPDFGRRHFKRIEKKHSNSIIGALEFGEHRADILRKENNISGKIPIFSIPNSMIGRPKKIRNHYFNELFNIPIEKKILLFAGSITNEFNDINTLWKSFRQWNKNTVLVFHSKSEFNILQKLKIPADLLNTNRIFINNNPIAFNELENIYSSCDIGLILNRLDSNIDTNLYFSDLSLGKLFHFVNNGVPVISRNLMGYKELIENNGIGFAFNHSAEISDYIDRIILNEAVMKDNCVKFSDKYCFENHHQIFEDFIETNT